MILRVVVVFLAILALCPVPAFTLDFTFIKASNVALKNPHDLKLSPDGKYLCVSDVGNNRIVALDPNTLTFIAAFGADHQSGTHDIDFDAAGKAYVADTHNNRCHDLHDAWHTGLADRPDRRPYARPGRRSCPPQRPDLCGRRLVWKRRCV